MNTKPRYSVGEHVIFTSKSNPLLSGEYVIRCVVRNGERYLDRISKSPTIIKLNHVLFAYRFSEVIMNSQGLEVIATEAQLKKKHTPGTVSFHRLMELVN